MRRSPYLASQVVDNVRSVGLLDRLTDITSEADSPSRDVLRIMAQASVGKWQAKAFRWSQKEAAKQA